MPQQIARVRQPVVAREIPRRSGCGKTLLPWPDRQCGHVGLEMLVVADTGIAVGGDDIDRIAVGHDLQPNLAVGRRQHRQHRQHRYEVRQHQTPGNLPVRSGTGAQTGYRGTCRPHRARPRPLCMVGTSRSSRRRPGLGGHDTACVAMEQSNAPPRCDPAHRIAQPRGIAGPLRAVSRKPPARAAATIASRSLNSFFILRLLARLWHANAVVGQPYAA